jgi:hypothetical protein
MKEFHHQYGISIVALPMSGFKATGCGLMRVLA